MNRQEEQQQQHRLTRVASCRSQRQQTLFELERQRRRRGGSFRAPPRKVVELEFIKPSISSPPLPAAVTIEGASPDEEVELVLRENKTKDGFAEKIFASKGSVGKKYGSGQVMNGGEDSSSPEPLSPWQPQVFDFNYQQRRPSAFADQFDEFVYKSQHMAHSSDLDMENAGYYPASAPVEPITDSVRTPEVNIEIPSDSDSSRRQSSYGLPLGAEANTMYANHSPRRKSAFQERRKGPIAAAAGGVGVCPPSPSLLRTKPLDRRSSHSGVLTRNGPSSSSAYYPRVGSCTRNSSNTLIVPKRRTRGSSLPGSILLDQEDIYRLRNFSMAGKKVINRGDSLKTTRSNHSINSTGSSGEILGSSHRSSSISADDCSGCSATSSRRPSKGSSRRSSNRHEHVPADPPPTLYKVVMLGASGVGKSALTLQFLSSDDMHTYDSVEDDVQKEVRVSVDGKESRIVFIDHACSDMSVENQIATYEPDGYIIVFAVDDMETLKAAEAVLQYLKAEAIIEQHAVILVANKTDLVRKRVVSTNVGKAVAIKAGCKYIETSPGINHNVDELLVGTVTQIQLHRDHQATNKKSKKHFKFFSFMEKVWKLQNNKTKSCGNLHIL